MKRLPLITLALALCLASYAVPQMLATASAADQTSVAPKPPKALPQVKVEILTPEPLIKSLTLTGSVVPTRMARIAAPVEGPVVTCADRSCLLREGDRVKKDQVLLRIGRNKTARAQLAAAEQTLHESDLELKRIEQLVEAGAIPAAQLDTARSALENARAQQAKALESAGDYTLLAPWAGVIAKVEVTDGDYVAPRATLLEIFDPDSLVLQFAVPEAQSTAVALHQPVSVQLDAYPGQTFSGQISRVYPQLDAALRTRRVEAKLQGSMTLLPGMFARISVELARIPAALMVPDEALLLTPKGERFAFVLQDGIAQKRVLRIGLEQSGRVQVVSGLRAGEQLIIAGQAKLKEGAQVQVAKEKTP